MESIRPVPEILTEFLSSLPIEDRKVVSSLLTHIRLKLDDVIPNETSVLPYLRKLKLLRNSFLRIPLFLRKRLKFTLIEGLQASLNTSIVSLSIFSICLCLLELSAFRNYDRIDLESEDIVNTVNQLNSLVLSQFAEKVAIQRTNLPSLLSWSACILVFTYRCCIDWICSLKVGNFDATSTVHVNFDNKLFKHPSMPLLARIILKTQHRNKPYFIHQSHTVIDLLFANAISSNTKLFRLCKPATKFLSSSYSIEQDEPDFHHNKVIKSANVPTHRYFVKDAINLPSNFEALLNSESDEVVLSNLQLLQNCLLECTDFNKPCILEPLIITLRLTPFILTRLERSLSTYDNSIPEQHQLRLYEQVYCLLLQFWLQAAEHRVLLTSFPQSYIWLVAFTCPNYAVMSLNGFVQAVRWTARFLSAYQSLFRSSVLASPHWYLQMITDAVVAVISQSEKAAKQGIQSAEVEDKLCACVVAISRPFSALRCEESEVYPELSRVIKVPLETILSRLATCSLATVPDLSEKNLTALETRGVKCRSVINPRLRELLQSHLILPMIRACDPWALGQARIGLKPASARLILKQLLGDSELLETNWEDIPAESKLDLPKPQTAVGGLHVAEKLAAKRKL